MLDRLVRQAYLRLGRRYGVAYVLAQGPSSLAIATIAVVLLTSYYDPSTGEVLLMLAVTWASTLAAIAFALWRGRPYLWRALAWQSSPAPGAEESIAAWDAATNYPMRSFRANVGVRGHDRRRAGDRLHHGGPRPRARGRARRPRGDAAARGATRRSSTTS